MGGPDFGFIALLAFTAFTIFYIIHTRHLERMARIEHGLDEEERPDGSSGIWIGIGVIMICIGVGLAIGYFIAVNNDMPLFIMIPCSILISAGLGIVGVYLIGKTNDL